MFFDSVEIKFSNITQMWKFINFLRDELQVPIKGDNVDKNFVSEVVNKSENSVSDSIDLIESDNEKYVICEYENAKIYHIRPIDFKDKMKPRITINKIREDGVYFDKLVHTAKAFC